ncbi:MAG: DUF1573 domain-containing protein [Candidatus Omnitrophota bacterium]|jgi:hypothetical protein|nr:MAG: DUF1573 domain-containing protein [Candidatus Omnitrophota bacterium]
MTRFLLFSSLALLILTSQITGWCQPEIRFDNHSFDFGDSYPFENLAHDFVFKNVGTEPLNITNIISTCGCTAAVSSASSVLPSGTGIVSVTLTTSSLPGKLEKGIGVQTNDPRHLELSLSVKTNVLQAWKFQPKQSFLIKEVLIGTKESQQLFLKCMEDKPYKILATKLSKPEFRIETGEPTDDGIPITLTVQAGMEKGPLTDNLEIRTDHPKQPIVRATVFANVVGYIKFSQPRLYFGSVIAGTSVTRQLMVNLTGSHNSKKLEIKKIVTDSHDISGKVIGSGDNGDNRLLFTLTPSGDAGFKSGEIQLHTNIDEEPIAMLTYSALIRRAR